MEAFSAPAPTSPPLSPSRRRCREVARRCERLCCNMFTYFPLAFVYGLTTWSVYVEAKIGMQPTKSRWIGPATSVLGIILYILLNSSYTIAVFTDPGSPLTGPRTNSRGNRHMYSSLPTTETSGYTNLTVSSAGGKRYCKKCMCIKPDRTHHCSSCQRCVLKMDHHCPWLATCVGFRNYKPFLLFLIYTCLFCWVCFAVSATWVWTEILNDTRYIESFGPVANVLLAVIAGIMGLVLSAFTGWHINLAARGSTTIECLEKTRYLAPIRKSFDRQRQIRASPVNGQIDHRLSHTLHSYGHQFLDAHANAIPGVTRAEEGEERSSPTIAPRQFHPEHVPTYAQHQHLSPAQQSLYHSYDEFEHARERARYDEYLDEQDGEKLPHAFDLGWRRNLIHLFGENPLLWFLPICNTTGDGWHWEASSEWLETKQRIENRRMQRWRGHQPLDQLHPLTAPQPPRSETWQYSGDTSDGVYSDVSRRPTNNEDFDDRGTHVQRPDTGLSMKTLRPMSPRPGAGEVVSEDDSTPPSQLSGRTRSEGQDEWHNWE
ncbi:palmitoyltransferase pfa3 [Histoplasma ohiense]|nr:palmitoyltransferase pfa3 [Histoplasma ohiense (nom. inval.)]